MGLFWNKKDDTAPQVTQSAVSTPPANVNVTDFRMVIKDIFDLKGEGKVVMGEVMAGTIAVGDIVYVNGEVLQVIQFENLTRFTPPERVPTPLPVAILESLIAPSGSGDIMAATNAVEDAAYMSTNMTSEGKIGETVSLLLQTAADKSVLKGATVFKVALPGKS